jgi:cyclopropane fatty-acyl-phospholipid synthase-like methyltransferase
MRYKKADKYKDLKFVYSQCSGPGGLKLAEFLANKMNLTKDEFLLDIGMNRGLQTCFLVKEYKVNAIGIDPWDDRITKKPHVEHLKENADILKIDKKILGIKTGVPDTGFADNSFRAIYSTTTFEMIRGMKSYEEYLSSLKEVLRILKPNGIFAYGEPIHLDIELSKEEKKIVENVWSNCFSTLENTIKSFKECGFKILEFGIPDDAVNWWNEFAEYDLFCNNDDSNSEVNAIKILNNKWLSFGYIIATKE